MFTADLTFLILIVTVILLSRGEWGPRVNDELKTPVRSKIKRQ